MLEFRSLLAISDPNYVDRSIFLNLQGTSKYRPVFRAVTIFLHNFLLIWGSHIIDTPSGPSMIGPASKITTDLKHLLLMSINPGEMSKISQVRE
jgi:hypothetical protein